MLTNAHVNGEEDWIDGRVRAMTSEQRAILEGMRDNFARDAKKFAILGPVFAGQERDHLDLVAILTAALGTCGNCEHRDDDAVMLPSLVTYCTNRRGFYNGKMMEKSARCSLWEPGS